jgi:HlyD family secretion protein
MTTGSTLHRRLVAVAFAPVLLLVACTSEEAEPMTVKVTRTSVTSSVTATGKLQAITEQNLGFPEAGKLVELNVAVGQPVEPGQVLARLDDFDSRQELEAASAQLAQEQAVLARIRDDNEVNAAEDDVKRSRDVLDATEEQAEAVDHANASAVEEAERRLKLDEKILEDTKDRARDTCDGFALAGRSRNCDAAQARVEEARRQVRESKAELDQAEEKQRVEHAQQELAIENARRDLTAAKNEAEGARGERPHNIDEQAAIVSRLQVDVDTAVRHVENTVLRAPAAGKIASINGAVGEFLAGGSATTPLAPGGTVPLPDAGSSVSSGDDVGGDGDRPGNSAFIVLDDVNSFRIVAPFAETDAARVQLNQQVQVTFDALPDLARTGSVVGIAPTGTDIQGVTSYYVTIVLGELDPQLMDGQTAAVHVVVDKLDNTLVVPNAAVQQSGRTGIVTVQEADGTRRQVQVELGLSGDGLTQVVAGLHEGQQVVIDQAE